MILVFSALCKNIYENKKLPFFRSSQMLYSTEASILTLRKSKKHLDDNMLFFQKSLSYKVVSASQTLFQKEERGSFCPGQDACFWLWHHIQCKLLRNWSVNVQGSLKN